MSVKKEELVQIGIFHIHKARERHFSEGKKLQVYMLSQHDSIYTIISCLFQIYGRTIQLSYSSNIVISRTNVDEGKKTHTFSMHFD